MSIDESDAGTQLQRNFEIYLTGEEPPPQALVRAPLLENWRAVVMQFGLASASLRMVLMGSVTNHPLLDEGKTIHTSQLIWLDRNRTWARTWNRVYRLGEPVDDSTEDEGEGL